MHDNIESHLVEKRVFKPRPDFSSRARIKSLAQRLLQTENCDDNTEVSIVFTNDENISILNKDYRDVDGLTDVLSFSQTEGEDAFDFEAEENLLGDVIISVETAQRQADEQSNSLDDEIDMLLVHGLLHLLGYDHAEPADADKMFARQAEILKKKGA
jgi:probable rRNA maturation factor